MSDLEQVIEDSVNDALSGTEPEIAEDTSVAEPVATDMQQDATPVETDETGEPVAPSTSAVASPATQQQTPAEPEAPKDPFAEAAGMPQFGVTGRENRIPYSRVKKISERAATDAESKIAETVLGRKLNQGEKAVDAVKAHIAQLPELTSKVTDYEGRLNTVGQFENVMANDPEKFLTMLAKLPAYNKFFQFVETAYNNMARPGAGQQPPQTAPQPEAQLTDDMPQPDEKLADGSAVYSMEGLKKLVSWTQAKARQDAVAEATKQFNERYSALDKQYQPILQAWRNHQVQQSVVPIIQAQIAEARNWPLFNELEGEITKALEQDKSISLEAAYRKVAFPKLVAERNTMRQDIIKELQSAPASTSVSSRTIRQVAPASNGPRNIEDVIREQVEQLKGN